MKKKILLLLLFIVVAVFAFFSWQGMSFSKEVLKIEILSSSDTSIGEKIEYIVKFKNNGNIRLENPELLFEYPENSIISNGSNRIKIVSSSELGGDLYPGEERIFKFEAMLLGKEKDIKIAKASISFQPKDLKTRNEVSTTFTTILGEAPVNLSLDIPAKVGAGKTLSFKVSYSSDASYSFQDLTCYVAYPNEFDFLYSQPKGIGNVQFDIPLLGEAGFGKIDVSGILNGESSEQKVFKARIGIWQNGNFVLLKEVIKSVQIISPSLHVTQRVNNDSTYSSFAGDKLHYELIFQNIGDEALYDLSLISRIESNYISSDSINSEAGKINGNSIVWEAIDSPSLKFLDVGQSGKVDFWIDVLPQWEMSGLENKNPTIKNRVTMGETRQDFLTKINSAVAVEQKFYTDDKYFENTGPYPLETGERTYMTIEWKANNLYNDVENFRMVTALPESITFEKFYPGGAEITYDELTNEVVCNIGSLPAGAGNIKDSTICAFQISIEPELSDEVIILLGAAQASGIDQWTNKNLTAKTDILYAQMSF
jgi:hypothetical protein